MEARIKIDDREILAQKGRTILAVALENGIYIPHLCFRPDLKPSGLCRLCVVEVNGGLTLSCREKVKDGLAIKTRTPEIDNIQKMVLELVMADNHETCKGCPKSGRCKLQEAIAHVRPDRKEVKLLKKPREELPKDTSNPFFDIDPNKCVLCGICVKTCEDIMAIGAIDFSDRGYKSKVCTPEENPIVESACISCGECVKRCPVGALYYKVFKEKPEKEAKTTCPFCSVGCQIVLGVKEDKIVSSDGGLLCAKGRFGWGFVHSKGRVLSPLLRRNGRLEQATWNEALEDMAESLEENRGKTAILVSAFCTNEEGYLGQKFSRNVLGSNNIDNISGLSDFKSLSALINAFEGIGLQPFDIEGASSIMVIGADVTKNNTVAGVKIKRALRTGSKLILIDPKETDLLRFADVWLRPYPGTDSALIMGMAKFLLGEGLFDSGFVTQCEGFDVFEKTLEDFTLRRVERITGVPVDLIEKAARILAENSPPAIVWSAGITDYMHGEKSVYALINLLLLTGNTKGLHPIFGEVNTRGICDMGCLPEFYPAWKRIEELAKGISLERVWDAILDENIKALYLIGVNPLAMPGDEKVKRALEKLDLLVVQDLFLDDLGEFVHVFLPSCSVAEKDGTFTNFEGRVQKINKVLDPLGESLPDWLIIARLARRMGGKDFDFENTEDVMQQIRSTIPSYNDDFSFEMKRSKFFSFEYEGPSGKPDIDYPLILVSEKRPFSGKFLNKADGFELLRENDDFLRMNPKDAMDFLIEDRGKVRVISRNGEAEAKVKITDSIPPGATYISYNPKVRNLFPKEEPRICTVRVE